MNDQVKFNPIWRYRSNINISVCFAVLILFIVTLLLFPRAARQYHYSAWAEYKTKFVWQAVGIATLLVVLLIQNFG